MTDQMTGNQPEQITEQDSGGYFSCNYVSGPHKISRLPSLNFYPQVAKIVCLAGIQAMRGKYSDKRWISDSEKIGQALENVGVHFTVEGFENVLAQQSPCVYIANHMSTLETFLLPSIIQPVHDITYVVKSILLRYPFFGAILKARKPIIVKRHNPREDLTVVLDEGKKHLAEGRSIIIFPQGTRSQTVNSEQFSSLGIKLARKAKAPVMPVALKTDAWGSGRIKDIGWIKPQKPVHIKFGQAQSVEGNGKDEHEAVVKFIVDNFAKWLAEDSLKNG